MNENELRAKLIAAARRNPPGDSVPFAFEKRITSHLRARSSAPNFWGLWCRPLWQAAISCVAITVLCGLWAYGNRPKTEVADNFSQDFEAAVLAPVSDHFEDAW